MNNDVLEFAQVMAVIVMSTASFVAIGLGARVLWRLGSRTKTPSMGSGDERHLQRLETAVDAIAIEVERISEAQRFMVALMSESLPARRGEQVSELASGDH